MTGHFAFDFKWRWAPTQEEKFLSGVSEEAHALPETSDTSVTWPGFRGGDRDSKVTGVAISSDWKAKPPLELWRRTIGPGCSSFAVAGGRIYTQEQRGESEAVTCYSLETGKPVWIHTDKARFWDSHAGAGPRGTPAYDDGCVYTLGATGILNALNANDGSVIWSRNAVGDTGGKDTGWGICGSPIVCDSIVVVAASGNLAAYDRASGNPLWQGPGGTTGYSSPQLYKKGGRTQVVLLSDMGAIGVDPREGKILWEYKWESQDRILQPAITEEGDILICSATEGFRRIAPEFENGEWNVGERWTSMAMKPFFNDIVVHRGFVYGFDGLAVTCASLADGSRKWRAGRYGGQLILLADQDLLLLLSERGELVLVQANPEKYTELGRFRAIEGKTWNHPVLAGDILLVRNSVEMAAFRLKP
jgi:outer membrane protein assembly factor BamB